LKPPAQPVTTPEAVSKATVDALVSACERLKPRRMLVVSAMPEVFADISIPGVGRCFLVGDANREIPGAGGTCEVMRASLAALPFLSEVFDLVVAHDLVGDGDERLLGELRRVLKPGGHLAVAGRGRYGLSALRHRTPGCRRIRPYRLCQRLKQRSFVIESRAGHGVAGLAMDTGSGWRQAFYGVSDHVHVLARFSPVRPVVRRVRFAQPAASGAGVQAMESALEHRVQAGNRSA